MLGALTVYLTQMAKITQPPTKVTWLSREMSLLLNGLLLFIAMCTILLGTLYPLILDSLHLGMISVGAPYFNSVMVPILLSVMLMMGLAPLCQFGKSIWPILWRKALKNLLGSLLLALIVLWSTQGHFDGMAFSILTLSFWIIGSIVPSMTHAPGMALAHLGFAILIVGIMLSSYLSIERQVRMQPGDSTPLGPYQFLFVTAKGTQGSNYRGIIATFAVTKNARPITLLQPEKRIYTVRQMVMTKVDIHPSIFRDLYIALGEPLDEEYWSVRLYYKPFMRWIWAGGFIMMLGGLWCMRPRLR